MTLINDLNYDDSMIEEYAELVKKASPLFIEVKGYMSVGFLCIFSRSLLLCSALFS
jgi:wyosine [tRNA(Phe)-imidazoG37] synthetase (radical SAM superfamily)